MAWPKKKPDPISDRSRTLNKQIAELESQIKKLDSELQRSQSPPRPNPPASAPAHPQVGPATTTPRATQEPIFEVVDQNRLKNRGDPATSPEHYNELGVRKYDLPALWQR